LDLRVASKILHRSNGLRVVIELVTNGNTELEFCNATYMSIASEVMGVSGAIANMQMESNDQELGLLSDYIPKVSN
jgi:tRNA threonylcarbamoyladenosine modification (KEOPS) complex  Pcc1 subunit